MSSYNNSALSINKVAASYTGTKVISDTTLDVGAGETYGLIGLNGAGKTTLIKCILGLRNQDEGDIKIFGQPSSQTAARRELAFLPERFEPPWFLSGLEFVKFSLSIYKKPYSEKAVYESSDKLALDTKALKRRVQTYSKGMRQKLGLIATVLTDCDLLILDEPMSGLDPMARVLVKNMLIDHVKKPGKTVFLSSRILADMDEICDRVTVLHDGTLRFTGTPEELKQKTQGENLEQSFLQLIEKRHAA